MGKTEQSALCDRNIFSLWPWARAVLCKNLWHNYQISFVSVELPTRKEHKLHCCNWLNCTKINNKRWCVHIISVALMLLQSVFVGTVWECSLMLVWPADSFFSHESKLTSLNLFCNVLIFSASCFMECVRKLNRSLHLSYHFIVCHNCELLFLP